MLALSRAEPGGRRPDALRTIDLRSIAQDAASIWVPRALPKDLDLGFELAPAPTVGDARLLRDLLDNLIDPATRPIFQKQFDAWDRIFKIEDPRVDQDVVKLGISAILVNDYECTKYSTFMATHARDARNHGSRRGASIRP